MRSLLTMTALTTVAALTGCTSTAIDSTSAGDAGAAISVVSTDDGCEVSSTTAPAGTLTFEVTNGGSKVTEFYLYSAADGRIVGEVENIGPGLAGSLVVTAREGSYQTSCRPGMAGDGIRADFTVSEPRRGDRSPSRDAVLIGRAQDRYRTYVQEQADRLLSGTERFVRAYRSAHDDTARALYPRARYHYEAIETVAESFGDLDPELDAREADLTEGQRWTGWHRIEKDLWPERDPAYHRLSAPQRRHLARVLLDDTRALVRRIGTLTFTTDQIANGSSGLMEEVATSKVTGEEEYWSHTDLWDFAGNVEGARVAFEDVRPILERREPGLARQLTRRFTEIERLLAAHRVGGDYPAYTRLSQAQVKRLSDAVNALSEPLSQLTAAVLP